MSDLSEQSDASSGLRQHWMSVLAKATIADLERCWARETHIPSYSMLRKPETGLVMLRGRIGGSGKPFNFGEATVTRCAVEIKGSGHFGQAYVMGTDRRHAEIAAVYDAMLQGASDRARLLQTVIAPLAEEQKQRRRAKMAKAAATRVEFFTLVRGEDE